MGFYRCQDDPNSSPTRGLEETARASPYHVAEHRPARSESLQPDTEQTTRPGPEPPCVEVDVYVWHYVLLVVHARKEEVFTDCVSFLSYNHQCQSTDMNINVKFTSMENVITTSDFRT